MTHELVSATLPVWSIIPFAGMLLSIAIVPLVRPEWWEKHMLGAAFAWSLLFLIPFAAAYGVGESWFRLLESVLLDYIPFIVLLFGLFVVAGGIAVCGTLAGTTKINCLLLFIGTFLASWIGTTGAAMLLIRPIIRANAWRKNKVHLMVFFIFLVANMGGCLTPLGDPPLFMGFQRGVPFTWTFHLLPILIFNLVLMFALFAVIDKHFYNKEIKEGRTPLDLIDENDKQPLRLEGAHNLIFIAMIIVGVLANGLLPDMFPAFANGAGLHIYDEIVFPYATLAEIVIILVAAFLSIKTTKTSTRELNEFTYAPILEVAKLFIGIFITMIPALILLKAHGAELGLTIRGRCSGQPVPCRPSWTTRRHTWSSSRWPVPSALPRASRPLSGPYPSSCWKPSRPVPSSWVPTRISAMHRTSWSNPLLKKTRSKCRASSATWAGPSPSSSRCSSSTPSFSSCKLWLVTRG